LCAVAVAVGVCVPAGAAHAQTPPALPTGHTAYRDLPETNAELLQIAAQYPDKVKLIKLDRQTLRGR
jgi:hypothetical protein